MSVATTSAASKWGMENTVCPAGIHEEVERIDVVEHKQVFFMPKLQAKDTNVEFAIMISKLASTLGILKRKSSL